MPDLVEFFKVVTQSFARGFKIGLSGKSAQRNFNQKKRELEAVLLSPGLSVEKVQTTNSVTTLRCTLCGTVGSCVSTPSAEMQWAADHRHFCYGCPTEGLF